MSVPWIGQYIQRLSERDIYNREHINKSMVNKITVDSVKRYLEKAVVNRRETEVRAEYRERL